MAYRTLNEFWYPSDRNKPIYDGGRIYSGEIWSDDHRFCIIVDSRGLQAGWTLYHPNGQRAMTLDKYGQNPSLYNESGVLQRTEYECSSWLNKYRTSYLAILNKAMDVISKRSI